MNRMNEMLLTVGVSSLTEFGLGLLVTLVVLALTWLRDGHR